jgi:TRAP-type C4-dicarboxylate transport system permease small subunit
VVGRSGEAPAAASAAPDRSPLARADRSAGRLEDALNLGGAIAIVGIMLFGVAQVLSRSVSTWLNAVLPTIPRFAIHGYLDYVQFAAIFYAMLGLAYCQRTDGHIRMEIVPAQLRGRAVWVVEAVASGLAVVVTILMIVGTWDNFHNAWSKGDSSIDLRLPLWPAKLVVPLMLAVLLVRLLLQLWGYLRLVRWPDAVPVAVPVARGAAQAARLEAEEAIARAETAGGGAGGAVR